ncbi:MAG: hypothetical protein ACUVUD_03545 [bacterium]
MDLVVAVLTLVRILPTEPAVLLVRLFILFYLAVRSDYRREISNNYRVIFGCTKRWFWVRNGWRVGKNIALMTKLGTKFANKLVDKGLIYWENYITSQTVEFDEPIIMVSFHFGLWELLPQFFVRRSARVEVVVSEQRSRVVNLFLQRLRKSNTVSLVFRIKQIFRRRSKTKITGFMLDNTSQGRQVLVELPVSLDGRKVCFRLPSIPFRVAEYWAVRSGSRGKKVVPVFGYLNRGRFTVRVFPAGNEVNALQALLKMVKEMPEEWLFWGKGGAVQGALGNR